MIPVFRAPMRARDRDVNGADFGIERGIVGIGDALPEQGEKGERMVRRFAGLPDGVFVWTRTADGAYFLGRISGPHRYEDSPVGLSHVRPADWLDRPFGEHEVPTAVAETFARGGRNLQRINSTAAERRTAELWAMR